MKLPHPFFELKNTANEEEFEKIKKVSIKAQLFPKYWYVGAIFLRNK